MAPSWLQGRQAGGWLSSMKYSIIAVFPKLLLRLSITKCAPCSAAAFTTDSAEEEYGRLAGWGQRKLLVAQWLGCRPAACPSHNEPICWFTWYLLIDSGRKEAFSLISSCRGYMFNKSKPRGTVGVWEQGRWMTGTHLSGYGNGRKHGCTVPFGGCYLSSCKMKPHAHLNYISSSLFNRAATVKTQWSMQFDLAATQTYKYYMQNHEEVRKDHIFTKQEPRASTQSQKSLKASGKAGTACSAWHCSGYETE